jgi:transcriptional regulator of acetoin/glycerol metabolism
LAVSQGNISKAAKLLGISRPHLYNLKKLREL